MDPETILQQKDEEEDNLKSLHTLKYYVPGATKHNVPYMRICKQNGIRQGQKTVFTG